MTEQGLAVLTIVVSVVGDVSNGDGCMREDEGIVVVTMGGWGSRRVNGFCWVVSCEME